VSLVTEPSSSEFQTAVKMVNRYKSPGIDRFRQNGSKQKEIHQILRLTRLLILFGIRRIARAV
jgi:hypothetical protein